MAASAQHDSGSRAIIALLVVRSLHDHDAIVSR